MKTALSTGPGFFAADSSDHNPKVKKGKVRIYCAKIEVYDIDDSEADNNTVFEILFAKAEKDPLVAEALLKLGGTIQANEENLKLFQSRG